MKKDIIGDVLLLRVNLFGLGLIWKQNFKSELSPGSEIQFEPRSKFEFDYFRYFDPRHWYNAYLYYIFLQSLNKILIWRQVEFFLIFIKFLLHYMYLKKCVVMWNKCFVIPYKKSFFISHCLLFWLYLIGIRCIKYKPLHGPTSKLYLESRSSSSHNF